MLSLRLSCFARRLDDSDALGTFDADAISIAYKYVFRLYKMTGSF